MGMSIENQSCGQIFQLGKKIPFFKQVFVGITPRSVHNAAVICEHVYG